MLRLITSVDKGRFLFGGTAGSSNRAYSDVFVLSLPGFVWRQVQFDDVSPRTDHHCAVVGNRQLVVVGGRTTSKSAANLEDGLLETRGHKGLACSTWRSGLGKTSTTPALVLIAAMKKFNAGTVRSKSAVVKSRNNS